MKTERRHNLETNELAHRIAMWIERIKPYSAQLFVAAIVLLGLAVANSLWNSHSASRQEAAWDAYALAIDTADPELLSLQRVAGEDQYTDTPMQEWAYVAWADRQVLWSAQTYLVDREASKDRLRRVAGIYDELASAARDRQIQNRARFGLARVYEMQNRLDDARRQYELVQGDLAPLASERAKQLDSPEVQAACAWLDTAKLPKRIATDGLGIPGSRPNFEAPLPSAPSGNSTPAVTHTLEELLGELDDESSDDDRYNKGDAEDAADENAATTDDDSAEVEPSKSDSSEDDQGNDSAEKDTSEP